MTPPIEPSPKPKTAEAQALDEPGTITGVWRAVDLELGRVTKWLVLFGIIGGGILSVMGIANAQVNDKLEVVKDKQDLDIQALKDHKAENERKFAAIEKEAERNREDKQLMNKKLDLLLDAARVPMYKRPDEPTRDGGTP